MIKLAARRYSINSITWESWKTVAASGRQCYKAEDLIEAFECSHHLHGVWGGTPARVWWENGWRNEGVWDGDWGVVCGWGFVKRKRVINALVWVLLRTFVTGTKVCGQLHARSKHRPTGANTCGQLWARKDHWLNGPKTFNGWGVKCCSVLNRI